MLDDSSRNPSEAPLDKALAEYLRRLDGGEVVDQEAFAAAHVDIADQLRSYFAQERDLAARVQGDETTDFHARPTVEPGAMIDGYKVLSILGEGGFGVVYLAESEGLLCRRVALKVIKPGMDSKQVIARFEAERQALAVMDHTNVAKVIDAGMTQSGQSYFVMEHVKGVPLTEHCDRYKLDIEERLKLFIDVCEAVQHAHQKGIIHRDLKPSNILISIDGNRALPKVIDFGVAKAIAVPLTEKTLYTEQGQIIGTPEYMSPEQAEMTGQDIDTRTDVYSLGVVLYQLLTGCLPFAAEYLRTGGLGHLVQVIREEEPKSPSTKVTSLASNDGNQIAEARQVELKELGRALKGDLDWVALKAMEKDRQRRYETAHGLAMDVQRYLDDEPVVARPASTAYRLRKMVQRNKIACLAVGAVLAALVIGLFLAAWGFFEADHHRRVAQTERDTARKARGAAELQRDEAREAKRIAEDAESKAAARAAELQRQNYLMHLANVDRAWFQGNWTWAELELNACSEPERGWEWSYLLRRFHERFPVRVSGSQEPIFSRDGKRLFAIGRLGSDDRFVQVWNLETGLKVDEFENENSITFAALSPDEQSLACGALDAELFVWNVSTGKKTWSDHSHKELFDGLAFSPDGRKIATANWDRTAKLYDAESGKLLYSVGPFKGHCRKITFSPDGDWFSVGQILFGDDAADEGVLVETASGKIVATFPVQGSVVPEFAPDGKQIATGHHDGRISLWEWNGSRLTETRAWQASEHRITSLDFSDNGELLASGEHSDDPGFVKLWEVSSGKELATLKAGEIVYWMKISPDGQHVAIFTMADGIRLWRFTERDSSLANVRGDIWSVRFSPDARKILVESWVGDESASVIVEAETGQELLSHGDWLGGGSWTPDGNSVVVPTTDNHAITLFNAETGLAIQSFVGHKRWALARVSRSGERLTSISEDGKVISWNVASGESIRSIELDGDEFRFETLIADISPAATRVAVALRGIYVVKILNLAGEQELTVNVSGITVESLLFNKDGTQLFVAGGGGTLMLLDATTGKLLKEFHGHSGSVLATAMSSDAGKVVTGDSSGQVVVWDAESGQVLLTLNHDGSAAVRSLDWSPDGRRIVAGLMGGTVKIWTLFDDE